MLVRPPSCCGAFARLRVVESRECTDNRALSWIFAAKGARYEKWMRIREEDRVPLENLTTFVGLVYALSEICSNLPPAHKKSITAKQFIASEGESAFLSVFW